MRFEARAVEAEEHRDTPASGRQDERSRATRERSGSEPSDDDLMMRCARGSDDAFRVLVERYSARVLNLIARWVGDRDRAEDLTQEVFVRVFRHRRNYRRTGRFSSWLYTIAVNIARNEIRLRNRRGATVAIDGVTGTNESGTIQLEDANRRTDRDAQQNEIGRVVRRAIQDLPRHHREVLILRDLQDLKYEEIADVLGIPGGTVRSRINRARLALRKRLGELLPEGEIASLEAEYGPSPA
jgi:RNA polymerase sigma-70 factor (ECF subfamily)